MSAAASPRPAHGGTIAKRIRTRVNRRNAERRNDALLAAGMGLLTIFFVYGLLFALVWMIGLFVFFNATIWFATAVTLVFFVVAVWSAWRKVDPAESLVAQTPEHPTVEWLVDVLGAMTDTPAYNTRFAIAGAGMLFLSGPENLFEAWSAWQARLPTEEIIVNNAAALLQRCRTGATVKDINDPLSAILLRQLLLIRIVSTGESPHLELTERGTKLFDKPRRKRPEDS